MESLCDQGQATSSPKLPPKVKMHGRGFDSTSTLSDLWVTPGQVTKHLWLSFPIRGSNNSAETQETRGRF